MRSSGIVSIPNFLLSVISLKPIGVSSKKISSSFSQMVSPLKISISSVCPLPAIPAIPSISPYLTFKFIFLREIPKSLLLDLLKFFNSNAVSSEIIFDCVFLSVLISLPTIVSARYFVVVFFALILAIDLPDFKIVTLSANSIISSSL